LEEKIEEDKLVRKMDRGKLSKWKKTSTSALEHLAEKKEGQDVKALKAWVKWT
jgi:hypothetical protein